MKLSNEILSEVLGFEPSCVKDVSKQENLVNYMKKGDIKGVWTSKSINLYELAFKHCIEWAKGRGEVVEYYLAQNGKHWVKCGSLMGFEVEEFRSDEACEAIFQAITWIYEKEKSK